MMSRRARIVAIADWLIPELVIAVSVITAYFIGATWPLAVVPWVGAASGFALRHAWWRGWRASKWPASVVAAPIATVLGLIPALALWADGRPRWDACLWYQAGVVAMFAVLAVREARKLARHEVPS